jgi:hypothetical protein
LANRTYENNNPAQNDSWIRGKPKFFSKEQMYNVYRGLPGVPAGGHDNYRKATADYMKSNLGLKDFNLGSIPDKNNFCHTHYLFALSCQQPSLSLCRIGSAAGSRISGCSPSS